MTDHHKGDHWGELASVLGAEVREDALADRPRPTERELAARQAATAPRAKADRPRRPKPSASWDALADSLGIEPSQPVAAPRENPPPVSASDAEAARTTESLPEPWKEAPASLGREPTVLPAHESASFGKVERDEPQELFHDGSEGHSGGASPCDVPRPTDDAPWPTTAEGEEEGSAEAESKERRQSKRGRSRRRRKKADGHAAETGIKPDSAADTDFDTDDDIGHDTLDDKADAPGHRSIPVWHEAVGLIVARNLESRAKRPNGGHSQPRGGRRSGRRGGGQAK